MRTVMGRTRCAIQIAVATSLLGCSSVAPRSDFEGLVSTTDGSVHVRSHGEGLDVVLLHGLGDSSVTWHEVEDEFVRAGMRVHAIDALGAGRSDKPAEGPYDIASRVRRLGEVLDQLGVGSCVLVGNSLGGSEALLFAIAQPRRVQAMVLISPAAWPKGGWTGSLLWRFPATIETTMSAVPSRWIAQVAMLANFGDPRRITSDVVERYAQEVERDGAIRAFVTLQRQILPSEQDVERWTAVYPHLHVPTLILWGTRDRIIDPAMGERLAAILPDARLVPLADVGHVAQLEAPAEVSGATIGFLREHSLID